ncbi:MULTISPECIES: hypothetical protein [unclassified Tychonema]
MTKCTNYYPDYFHRFSSVAAVFVGDAIGPKPEIELQRPGWR